MIFSVSGTKCCTRRGGAAAGRDRREPGGWVRLVREYENHSLISYLAEQGLTAELLELLGPTAPTVSSGVGANDWAPFGRQIPPTVNPTSRAPGGPRDMARWFV
jgi:hypothetical protein